MKLTGQSPRNSYRVQIVSGNGTHQGVGKAEISSPGWLTKYGWVRLVLLTTKSTASNRDLPPESSQYSTLWPTRLDEIKNFHAQVQYGTVTGIPTAVLVHVRRVGGASHVDMGKQLDDYSFDQVRYTRRGQPQGAVSEVVDQARGGVALYRQRVLNMRYSPYNRRRTPTR